MIFYLLSLLPVIAWGIQWYFNHEVIWKEAAIGTAVALATATVFHLIGTSGAFIPSDTETWSGQVHYAQFQPRWKEYYEEAIYEYEQTGVDSDGDPVYSWVFSHYEPRSRWHDDEWWVDTELGTFRVNQSRYLDVLDNFGGTIEKVEGDRRTAEHASRMIEGTPYDDRTINTASYVYPITKNHRFENRLLKASTLYNFEPVTEEQAQSLFEWPENSNKFDTDRLLGTAIEIWDQRSWDQMNALLGPTKKVNVIAIGFPDGTTQFTGVLQERYWNGGKKNDLVITFGGDPSSPDWAYVFGWTEREVVKRLLENRLRDGLATTSEISKLVVDEYELCEFEEKFEHVKIEAPWWFYLIFFIVTGLSQGVAHIVFSGNLQRKWS